MVQKYLFKRSNIYYFRWRIPSALRLFLGLTEIRRSLQCSEQSRAVARAGKFTLAVHRLLDANRLFQFSEIGFSEYTSCINGALRELGCMPPKDQSFKHILWELASGEKITIDYDGDQQKESEAFSKAIEARSKLSTPTAAPSICPPSVLYSELYSDFLKHKIAKEGLSDKIVKEYGRYQDAMIEIMGDLPVASITRKVLKDAITIYSDLPRRNKKAYKGLPVSELLELDIPVEDRLADKSVEQVRKMVQGIFAYAEQQELLKESPARNLKLKLSSTRTFAAFTDKEVLSILEATTNEKNEWKRWMPLLAAYSGARRGELAQLRSEDVKLDSDTGRYYLQITPEAGAVKTSNAVRQIPLHEQLVSAGFVQFSESKSGKLFDGLIPNTLTNWFRPLLNQLGIDSHDVYGNRKVFHSFRHSFITKSRHAGNQTDLVQQVVGHEKVSAGITDRYTHSAPLRDVLAVVDRVIFSINT